MLEVSKAVQRLINVERKEKEQLREEKEQLGKENEQLRNKLAATKAALAAKAQDPSADKV